MEILIFKDKKGNIISEAEFVKGDDNYDFEFCGSFEHNPEADKLHQMGRMNGQTGNFDEAIKCFKQAHEIQPEWPYPIYDMAFSYCYKGEFDTALKLFKQVDRLVPKGYFDSKEAIYSLEGEKTGIFPTGIFMYYMQLKLYPDLTY